MRNSEYNISGFTFIEFVFIIMVVSILAVAVFVALDPVARLVDDRNSERWLDVNSILTAVHQSIIDNDGTLPLGLIPSMSISQLGTAGSGCNTTCTVATASACVNLNGSLAKYLNTIPTEPSSGTDSETGYYIYVDNNNIVTVGSCVSEKGEKVEVNR